MHMSKGQPLSLWLIKIEPKPTKVNLNSIVEPEGHGEHVLLANRENFPLPFMTRLDKAKEICMTGINVNGIIKLYGHYFIEKAQNGCKFKFLLVNPRFFESEEMAFALWPGGTDSLIDLGNTIDEIEKMIKEVGNGNIQLNFSAFPPPYSLLMINPEEPNGEIQVEIYTYQSLTNKRPHFILDRQSHPDWYNFFFQDFDISWQQSYPHKPTYGIKPHKKKAGVVVYRQSENGKLELLLITAKSREQKWIFPLGAVDAGETLEQTAIRECAEESGYIVEIISELGTTITNGGTSIDHSTFFLAKECGEKEHFDEQEYRQRFWARPSQIVDMVIKEFKPIAKSALEHLEL